MKIDLDHFKTIEELERDLIGWIREEDIYSFDRYLNKEDVLKIVRLLLKKEKIIKEIRKYIKENEKEYGSLEDNEKIILNIIKGEDK